MSTNKLESICKPAIPQPGNLQENRCAVATPVWFAEENATFYIYSLANAGKVKTIRNNPQVRIVPCNARGKPKDKWVEAKARILDGGAATLGQRLLDNKYGLMKRIADVFSKLTQRQKVVIALDILSYRRNRSAGAVSKRLIVARKRLIANL